MATYNFSAITAAEALGIGASDTLVLDLGRGNETSVVFSGADQVTIVAGGRTVVFGAGVATAEKTFSGGGSLFIGGSGGDQASLDAASDGLYGAQASDTLAGGGGDDLLQGNQGADSLSGGVGYDVMYGGQDDDVIDVGEEAAGRNFAQGNRGSDTILGAAGGDDTLLGGQGDDLINAALVTVLDLGVLEPVDARLGSGGDFINGNLGNDILFGGYGDDRMLGEDGSDYIFDYGGRNLLDGGAGEDTIISVADGPSTIAGGAGSDVIVLVGSNTIDAGAGDDAIAFVSSSGAQNFLRMGDGNDVCLIASDVVNPADRFTVDGGAGDDFINTGDGSDSLVGGAGADTLDGFGGADTVAGGAGSDVFQFYSGEAFTEFQGLDQIIDWSSEDKLFFANLTTSDPVGLATTSNYVSGTGATYTAALKFANAQIGSGLIDYVVVEVGADVYVFCDSFYDAGAADSAVRLVGRTLADISVANFTDGGG